MSNINYRVYKRLPLTFDEVDDNYHKINEEKLEPNFVFPARGIKKTIFKDGDVNMMTVSLDIYIGGTQPPNGEAYWVIPVDAEGNILVSSKAIISDEATIEVHSNSSDFIQFVTDDLIPEYQPQ